MNKTELIAKINAAINSGNEEAILFVSSMIMCEPQVKACDIADDTDNGFTLDSGKGGGKRGKGYYRQQKEEHRDAVVAVLKEKGFKAAAIEKAKRNPRAAEDMLRGRHLDRLCEAGADYFGMPTARQRRQEPLIDKGLAPEDKGVLGNYPEWGGANKIPPLSKGAIILKKNYYPGETIGSLLSEKALDFIGIPFEFRKEFRGSPDMLLRKDARVINTLYALQVDALQCKKETGLEVILNVPENIKILIDPNYTGFSEYAVGNIYG